MRKTPKMIEIEKRENKPIEDILIETFNREGSVTGAAASLGVNKGTVSLWIRLLRLRIEQKLIRDNNRCA